MGTTVEVAGPMIAMAGIYLESWEETGDKLPTLNGMASKMGVSIQSLRKFRRENADVAELCDRLLTEKRRVLLNAGFVKNPIKLLEVDFERDLTPAEKPEDENPKGEPSPLRAVPTMPADDASEAEWSEYQKKLIKGR